MYTINQWTIFIEYTVDEGVVNLFVAISVDLVNALHSICSNQYGYCYLKYIVEHPFTF
jgi:hypothetical protein